MPSLVSIAILLGSWCCLQQTALRLVSGEPDDVNKYAPIFSQTEYEVLLDGSTANPGTGVVQVKAVDADGDKLTYAIAGGNLNDAFAINADSGAITIASTQTYAETDKFVLLVTATDEGAVPHIASTSVNVLIWHSTNSVSLNDDEIVALF